MKALLVKFCLAGLIFTSVSPMPSFAGGFMLFDPSGCIWATAPALYGSPITKDDLRKCVEGLIEGIRDSDKQLKSLQEMVALQLQIIKNLMNDMREIEKRLQSIESIIANEAIEKEKRR